MPARTARRAGRRVRAEAGRPRASGGAVHRYSADRRVVVNLDSSLLAPLATSLLAGDLADEYTVASDHGFSEEQVEMTMAVLTGLRMARTTDTGWTLTDLGRSQLPRLIAAMPSCCGKL